VVRFAGPDIVPHLTEDVRRSRLEAIASAMGVERARHHVFLCADQTVPKCASVERSRGIWTHLERRLEQESLSSSPPTWRGDPAEEPPPPTSSGTGRMLRSKVDCLLVCEQGPIAVVYPEGIWYRLPDEAAVDRLVDELLIGGRVVDGLAFAVGPLTEHPL
jgi:(2Fe-2S) ferredoxin